VGLVTQLCGDQFKTTDSVNLKLKNVTYLWQKMIIECCKMIMLEVEGAKLICGRYDRNKGDLTA
jgi:hypothetical protein